MNINDTELTDLLRRGNLSRREALGVLKSMGIVVASSAVARSALADGRDPDDIVRPSLTSSSSRQSTHIQYLDDCARDIGIIFDYGRRLPKSLPRVGGSAHTGLDVGTKKRKGDLVVAAAPGKVVGTDFEECGGNQLYIKHYLTVKDSSRQSGLKEYDAITAYLHLNNFLVKEGDWVFGGQPVALPGNTGKCTMGEHTHFEVKLTGGFEEAFVSKYRDGSLLRSDLKIPFSRTSDYWKYETSPINPRLFWFDGIGQIATFDPERHKWFDKHFKYPDHVAPLTLVFPIIRPSCNPKLIEHLRANYSF